MFYGSASGLDMDYYNCKNVDKTIDIRKELNIKKDDFIFVFVGRIVKDKGVNELVSAFAKLNDIYNKIHLILVGPTNSEQNRISEETHNIIMNNKNIYQVGSKSDIRPYLMVANALVLPSYREGFGMVLVEAGAMSVPAIASDIIGCNEIIINGVNGDLVNPKNEESLFMVMKKWIESPEYVQKLSQNTRKFVEERYSQKMVWNALLEFYKTL